MQRARSSVLLVIFAIAPALAMLALPSPGFPSDEVDGRWQVAVVIEDFESGAVPLDSYPGQDSDPNAWEITTANPYGGSYALRLYGNTWKTQQIAPYPITDGTVWQVAVYVEDLGEMQAFGVSDGANELLYTLAGEQLPEETKWWTVYQGAFPHGQWYAYQLPVGRDWFVTYGYHPELSQLIYVNDDDAGAAGTTVFDQIIDVTGDLPVPPTVDILYTIESSRQVGVNLFLVGVQFYSQVFDPDSQTHTFAWDFGDSTISHEADPVHEFLVEADYRYTVGLVVRDDDALAGNDTCQVWVNGGSGDLPITVNFVGDVFTGRQYETSGGIIDTYGIEALFEPTLPILGDAADVSVANLECQYTDRGTRHPTKSVVFRSRPENIVGIQYAGIDVVDIGNNHIIDYGEIGMLDTMELLDGMGIPYSGAGVNEYFALQPCFWTERGVRLAFLGQCNRTGRTWNYQPFLDAGYNKPGFAYLLPHNLDAAIDGARDAADVVIVQLHSGDEYQTAPPPGRAGGGGENVAQYDGGRLPRVEAAVIHAEDPDFRFLVEPTPSERELRRAALDLGADVLINHHPHVLQGFEAHDGKLIAHSLGNFIFDLYYPETFPTIVLNLEIDKDGIVGYTFTPAWIDDYIPHPATGQLGREIIDRMADYSRPMQAIVATQPGESVARIHLSRSDADSTLLAGLEATAALVEDGGYKISPPLKLSGQGNLSRIAAVMGDATGGWEIAWGREILWHGGFEAEGATLWDDNTEDEWLDEVEFHGGARSLALRRHAQDSGEVGTDLERHLPCNSDQRHSCAGFLKTDNAASARMMARFYSSRSASTPISSTDVAPRVTGSQGWTGQWIDLDTPAGATYFEVRCSNEPPSAGIGHAWFDDIAFIEWEPWVAWSPGGGIDVPSPNNYRFVQLRSTDLGATSATIVYDETAYALLTTAVEAPVLPAATHQLQNVPNPFNPRTTLALTLAGRGGDTIPVTLSIYDVQGRRVAGVFDGILDGGRQHGFTWDGKNDGGRALPSGIYFARAQAGGVVLNHKMVLLR